MAEEWNHGDNKYWKRIKDDFEIAVKNETDIGKISVTLGNAYPDLHIGISKGEIPRFSGAKAWGKEKGVCYIILEKK